MNKKRGLILTVTVCTLVFALSLSATSTGISDRVAARLEGMGNAATALSDDPMCVFMNPASIGDIFMTSAGVSYNNVFPGIDGLHQYTFVAVQPVYRVKGSVLVNAAFSMRSFTADDLFEAGWFSVTGTFNFGKFRALHSIGLKNVILGLQVENIGFKYINTSEFSNPIMAANNTPSAFNMNAGLLVTGPIDNLSFGFAVHNLLLPSFSITGDASAEYDLRYDVGAAYRIVINTNMNVLASVDGAYVDGALEGRAGGEFTLFDMVAFRLGVGFGAVAPFTLGAGLGVTLPFDHVDITFNSGLTFNPQLAQMQNGIQNVSVDVTIQMH